MPGHGKLRRADGVGGVHRPPCSRRRGSGRPRPGRSGCERPGLRRGGAPVELPEGAGGYVRPMARRAYGLPHSGRAPGAFRADCVRRDLHRRCRRRRSGAAAAWKAGRSGIPPESGNTRHGGRLDHPGEDPLSGGAHRVLLRTRRPHRVRAIRRLGGLPPGPAARWTICRPRCWRPSTGPCCPTRIALPPNSPKRGGCWSGAQRRRERGRECAAQTRSSRKRRPGYLVSRRATWPPRQGGGPPLGIPAAADSTRRRGTPGIRSGAQGRRDNRSVRSRGLRESPLGAAYRAGGARTSDARGAIG